MLKKLTLNDKSTFVLWLTVIVCYSLFVLIGGKQFDWVWFLALSNIALFPGLFHRSSLIENKIDDPLAHVSFKNGCMFIGEVNLKVSDIRKVALDAVGQDAYFSLPYNQVKPGQIPNMIFAAGKMTEFKQHLKKNLPSDVVFIH